MSKEDKILGETFSTIKGWVTGLYLFLMFAVFVFYSPEKYDYIGNRKIAYFEKVTAVFLALIILFGIIALINRLCNKKKLSFKTTPVQKVFLIWGLWIIVSYVFSSYKSESIFGYEGWRMGLFAQLSMIAIFFVCQYYAGNTEWVLYMAVAALVAESIIIILQRLGFDPFGLYQGMELTEWNRRNLLGTIGNRNWLMGYQICIAPLLIWLYVTAEKTYMRIVFGISVFLMMAALFLQGSRSGIIALAAIIYILLLIYSNNAVKTARIAETVCAICLFWLIFSAFNVKLLEPEEMDTTRMYSWLWLIPALVLAAFITGIYVYIRKSKKEKFPDRVGILIRVCLISLVLLATAGIFAIQLSDPLWRLLGSNNSLRITDMSGSGRILLWKSCLQGFLADSKVKELIFGVGPDCFGFWYQTKNIVIPVEGGPFGEAVFTNAHNDLLTAMVNYGIPGMILYSSTFIIMLITLIKRCGKGLSNWSVLGIAVLMGYFINNIFSFQQVCSSPLFYIIMGLIFREVYKESDYKSAR